MQAAARRARQRLGHAREHLAVLLRHRVRGQLEQLVAVGRGQGLVVPVVDLVLADGVFVVHLLQFKTQRREVAAHVVEEAEVAVDRLQVVGRFVQPVVRIGHAPVALSVLLQQKELGFDADVECPAAFAQALNLVFQDLPRAGVQRFATGKAVAHRVRHTGQEGQRAQRLGHHTPVVLAARAHAR
ncbi:hypothetical protein D9M68_760640 [compost metagenome]